MPSIPRNVAFMRALYRHSAFAGSMQQGFAARYLHRIRSSLCNENNFLVLGIESSCDDTGVAIVSSHGNVMSNIVRSQGDIHAQWGGVVPKLAQEAHMKAIDSCVEEALRDAQVTLRDIDAVAVTVGPGLSLCLRVGVSKAADLCTHLGIEMIPIHHMEAHAMISRLVHSDLQFPFLCLLVSGGHNMLVIVEGLGQYVQLGTTLDDALGEAYDKVARILDISLVPSGGASLEILAKGGNPDTFQFPIPLKKRKTCDFSYAGLKTAVRLAVEKAQDANGSVVLPQQVKADVAASFQKVAVAHLEERCRRAFDWARESHPNISHLVVAGGVASNQFLRSRLEMVCKDYNAHLVCPPPNLCTDNGAMVAWTGVERIRARLILEDRESEVQRPEGWLDLKPRWPLTERKDPRAFIAERSAKKKNIHASLEQLTLAPRGKSTL